MAAASSRLLSQVIMCNTWDVPRYHETKESFNKGKQTNNYWPKHIFASCGHAQWTHDTKLFGHLRRRFRVNIPSLVLISQRVAEILPNFLFGCFVANFVLDKRFWKKKSLDNFSEGCSDDDVCQIWGRLEKNWLKIVFGDNGSWLVLWLNILSIFFNSCLENM